jgi:hypothetical protein
MYVIKMLGQHIGPFMALPLLSFLILLGGCTFGSQGGMENGLSQQGIYCIRGAVKFTPTPASLAFGAPDAQTSQVIDEECKNLANEFGTSWKFFKPDDPQSVIFWTK